LEDSVTRVEGTAASSAAAKGMVRFLQIEPTTRVAPTMQVALTTEVASTRRIEPIRQ